LKAKSKRRKRKGTRSRFLDNHDIEEEDGDTRKAKEGLGENKWIVFEEFSFLFNLSATQHSDV